MSISPIEVFGIASPRGEHFQRVHEVSLRLVMLSSKSIQCTAFLRSISQFSALPETLIERLNDPEVRFLAFRTPEGVRLINLSCISTLEFDGVSVEVDKSIEQQCQRETVEFFMTNGDKVRGDVLYGLPRANSRVSDLLNTPHQRFILIFNGTTTGYINRDAVSLVNHVRSVPWQR